MSIWDNYSERMSVRGNTKREHTYNKIAHRLSDNIMDSLSYHNVKIDGEERNVSIINSDNLDIKKVLSMPGEDIRNGAMVEWADNIWVVTEKDANNELYTKVMMRQCNYLLRWIDGNGDIREQWCIVDDGTKYLTGEFEDRNYIVKRGDARVVMVISRNEYTVNLTRKNRFIIDDYDCKDPIAYRLTKPLKLGNSYDNNGVLVFILTECNKEKTDNLELHIADYYKYFNEDGSKVDYINNNDSVSNILPDEQNKDIINKSEQEVDSWI